MNLDYPPITDEEDIMVVGRLESNKRELRISPEWSLEILARIDNSKDVLWVSGKIPLAENGGFVKVLPLRERENFFELKLANPQGNFVEMDKMSFSIRKSCRFF